MKFLFLTGVTRALNVHAIFFGPPMEDIFSGHLSPIFQSTLHITITIFCLGVVYIDGSRAVVV